MRTICLDVGERRIGVAVSDALDLTAQGVETIQVRGIENDVRRVKELCAMYETTHILCGLPLNMDGSAGFQAERVRKVAAALEAEGFEVRFQDERMTTKLATGVLLQADISRSRRKDYVDKLAATYILQSFMDAGGWKDKPIKFYESEIWRMSDQEMNSFEEEQENIVTLVDENGNEVVFEHLMTLNHKDGVYICLVPAQEMEDVEEDELVIMRIQQDDAGNDMYTTIESEEELQEVYEEYLRIAEEDDE